MYTLLLLGAMIMADVEAKEAVALLKQGDSGVMASIIGDDPYVSSMPFVLDNKGKPVIFISDLARHAKNVKTKPNVSIIVNKPDANGSYFAGSRATITGKLVKVTEEKDVAACRKLYMDKYPEAEEWADWGDFSYYRMDEIFAVYYIGGFGRIHLINTEKYQDALK